MLQIITDALSSTAYILNLSATAPLFGIYLLVIALAFIYTFIKK